MARYRDAIQWIADNDDTSWVEDHYDIPSVTAALVADLFDKTNEQVLADIKKALDRNQKQEN